MPPIDLQSLIRDVAGFVAIFVGFVEKWAEVKVFNIYINFLFSLFCILLDIKKSWCSCVVRDRDRETELRSKLRERDGMRETERLG